MKSINKKSRKTRSDTFPLTLHSTGQYCKKIKGKFYYFGSDKQQALKNYLSQANNLHYSQFYQSKSAKQNITIKQLCNLYLDFQEKREDAGDITKRYYSEQVCSSCPDQSGLISAFDF